MLQILAGADVSAISADGFTPLHVAAYNNHEALCMILLENGAQPNVPDALGNTRKLILAQLFWLVGCNLNGSSNNSSLILLPCDYCEIVIFYEIIYCRQSFVSFDSDIFFVSNIR